MYKQKLLDIGIPAHIYGFDHLNEILMLYSPEKHITDLYNEVGKKAGVKGAAVERNIRHAISKSINPMHNAAWISAMKLAWDEDLKPKSDEDIPTGWMCPQCGVVHAPLVQACMCSAFTYLNSAETILACEYDFPPRHIKYLMGWMKNHSCTLDQAMAEPMVQAHLAFCRSMTLDGGTEQLFKEGC